MLKNRDVSEQFVVMLLGILEDNGDELARIYTGLREKLIEGKAEADLGGRIKGFSKAAWNTLGYNIPASLIAATTLATVFGGPFLMYKYAKKELFTPTVLTKVPLQGEGLNENNFVGTPEMLKKLGTVNQLLRNAKINNKDAFHILLVGPPGVGKTEFTRFLGDETGLDVFSFNIKNLPAGQRGIELFQEIDARRRGNRFRKPCIMVVDEADTVIMSRKTHAGKHDKTSHEVLNALLQATGSDEKTFQGVYIFITNTPECVDEAILDRSLVVKFEELSKEAKAGLLMAKLKKTLPELTVNQVDNLTKDVFLQNTKGVGLAVIQNKVLRKSLLGIRSGRGISKLNKYLTLKILGTGKKSEKDLDIFKQEFMSFMMDEVEYSERLQIQERKELQALGLSSVAA
jgi:SpoVK/Ycf46/Vps4 family AAA+-type ATPase